MGAVLKGVVVCTSLYDPLALPSCTPRAERSRLRMTRINDIMQWKRADKEEEWEVRRVEEAATAIADTVEQLVVVTQIRGARVTAADTARAAVAAAVAAAAAAAAAAAGGAGVADMVAAAVSVVMSGVGSGSTSSAIVTGPPKVGLDGSAAAAALASVAAAAAAVGAAAVAAVSGAGVDGATDDSVVGAAVDGSTGDTVSDGASASASASASGGASANGGVSDCISASDSTSDSAGCVSGSGSKGSRRISDEGEDEVARRKGAEGSLELIMKELEVQGVWQDCLEQERRAVDASEETRATALLEMVETGDGQAAPPQRGILGIHHPLLLLLPLLLHLYPSNALLFLPTAYTPPHASSP